MSMRTPNKNDTNGVFDFVEKPDCIVYIMVEFVRFTLKYKHYFHIMALLIRKVTYL